MKAKEYYNLILGLADDQVEQLYKMSARMGITVPELIERTIDLLENETIEEGLMEKMYVDSEPTFLSYLMSLSDGDFREFVDCLLFLKQKQDEADEVDVLLKRIEGHAIDEVDENAMTELRRACGNYGIDIDKENDDVIKTCLEEVKQNIRADMYVPDLDFEPDNLYSAVDVVKERFDEYCRIYMKEDADMTEELKKVFAWIEENEKRFQSLNE